MHLVKKKGNIQRVLMRGIIILKLAFVVGVSSGPGVMKWLWHRVSDSCGDERGNRVQTVQIHYSDVRAAFYQNLARFNIYGVLQERNKNMKHRLWGDEETPPWLWFKQLRQKFDPSMYNFYTTQLLLNCRKIIFLWHWGWGFCWLFEELISAVFTFCQCANSDHTSF